MLDFPHSDDQDVDREIRIERMKNEINDLSDGSMIMGGADDVSPEIEEAFLARVLAFEKAELDTNFNRLARRGTVMEPPDELDDAALRAKLNEVLQSLAAMSCFLYDTDHLSDRELYEWLWKDGLREETADPADVGGAMHTSPIGSGSEEDTIIHLRHYATEDERRDWHKQFPDDPLPPHESLPYDRDRKLPRAPWDKPPNGREHQ